MWRTQVAFPLECGGTRLHCRGMHRGSRLPLLLTMTLKLKSAVVIPGSWLGSYITVDVEANPSRTLLPYPASSVEGRLFDQRDRDKALGLYFEDSLRPEFGDGQSLTVSWRRLGKQPTLVRRPHKFATLSIGMPCCYIHGNILHETNIRYD